MYQTLSFDEWIEQYKPIQNPKNNYGEEFTFSSFETYGEELDFVRSHDDKFIWTEVDGDGGTYIISGYSLVNRINYYICEVPHTGKFQQVPTCIYKDCETCDGDPKDYCADCDGMGDISHYPDTREELVALLGDTANATI